MTDATAPDPKLAAARRTRMIVMLVYYFVLVALVAWLWHSHVRITRWADLAAVGVAMVCVLGAGRLLYESFNRRLLSERLDAEGDPAPGEALRVRVQAALVFSMGVILVLPNVAFGFAWPPVLIYAVIVAFVIGRSITAWRSLQRADEFLRRRMFETAWWTTMLTTTGLLLYGGAERLGLVKVATSWDVLVLVVGLSIVTPSFLFRKPKPAA